MLVKVSAALFVLFDIFFASMRLPSGAMETPETTHEKIGTYMSADCFFALHQFFFILMHQMIVSLPSIVYNDKYFEI